MNWFTKQFATPKLSAEKRAKKVLEHGGCDHVIQDPNLLYVIQYENDSFGREGYCSCQACYEAGQVEAGQRIVTCQECHGEFPKSETMTWRWYDFYAAQGDEAMVLCKTCYAGPKHQARMEKDRQDADEEHAYYARLRR
jgi:hypothetical protein